MFRILPKSTRIDPLSTYTRLVRSSGTDTWDLSGVDVLDAIRWAQDQAGDEGLYALALVRDEPESDPSRGLVWLVGMDWFDSVDGDPERQRIKDRSEEHTSEIQSLMRNSYAVFCLNKKKNK